MKKAIVFDLVELINRQRAWSYRTFGGGASTERIRNHLEKEARDMAESTTAQGELREAVDMVLLLLDLMWRLGYEPEEIACSIAAKQEINEGRQWPNWRTAPKYKAIEHVRGEASKGGAA